MRRTFVLWLAVLSAFAVSLAAQDIPGEFIVELTGQPAAAAARQKGPRSAASRAAARAAQAGVRAALEAKHVRILASVDTVLNALVVSSGDPAAIRATPGVAQVYPVRLYKMLLDRALRLHQIGDAGATIGGSEGAGAGMKIAVIDSGIDTTHPAFSDVGFSMPDGFPRVNKDTDHRYTNNKVIVARNYDRQVSATATDRRGHGTAVAMIAAGIRNTGPRATIVGVAPKAYLGNYKVFADEEEAASNATILRAIDDAVADGMDVINLSLGQFPAERLEFDPVAKAIENASRAGVIVVVAAGNEGPGLNTIGSPATAPMAISVGATSNDRIFSSVAWLDGLDPFVAVPPVGGGRVSSIRGSMTDLFSIDPTGRGCSGLPAGSLQGKIALILRGECFFEDKLNVAQRAGAVAAVIFTDADRPEPDTMDVREATLPAVMISYADGLKARERLAAGPVEILVDFSSRAVPVNPNRLAGFSSKGPGVDRQIKPDLLAVGTAVYTAQPSDDGGPDYGAFNGTSFSAPIVAGAAALLKAYRPGLTTAEYKSLLTNTSTVFIDGLAVQQGGAGFLDIGAAVRSTLTSVPSALDFGSGGSTIGLSQRIVLKNIGGTADTFSLAVQSSADGARPEVTPNTIELAPGATAEVEARLNGTNLPARAHEGFLVIRGTQTNTSTRIPYWYAVTGKVASITVVEAPASGRPTGTVDFLVRALDASGVPVNVEPKVTVLSGTGARVVSVESMDERYPGFYSVRVRLGNETGDNVYQIEMDVVTALVTISGV